MRVKGGKVTHLRRKRILKQAKGYFGSKHILYKTAKEQVLRSLRYAYIYDVIVAMIVSLILLFGASSLVRLISGSTEATVINNGSLYLQIVGPFYMILGILMQTRYALQGIGQKMLPLISSVIEFVGKIIFVVIFIPRFQYMAVIFCEPVIWCVMAIQLVYSFYSNKYIKSVK